MTHSWGQCGTPLRVYRYSVHIWQRSNTAISISPHGNDVQGGTIPGRIHEVCSFNFQEHSCTHVWRKCRVGPAGDKGDSF
jgi:hypothetical protein